MDKKAVHIYKEDALLPNPRLFFLALALGVIFMDPLRLGPLSGQNFRPMKQEVAPYDQVMKHWPRDNLSRLRLGQLEFVNEVFGPESLEFDHRGRGPYAGLADGRVVRWVGGNIGWETFALVSPNWNEKVCANGVNSTTWRQHKHEKLCGRPLGLRFDSKTGELYVADAYYGLAVVGPDGGAASHLATHVHGEPILFANDLDLHQNGSIFFTDTSTRHDRRNHHFILMEGEGTGRLLRFDPDSKTTHVVLNGLSFPNGVQLSKDQRFLLFTETTSCRIMRLWLEGPEQGKLEVFANLPGLPDNVRINDKGQFWVAIDCCRTRAQQTLSRNPWLKNIYFRLPLNLKYLALMVGMRMHTMIALFDEEGKMVDVLEDLHGEVMKLVSEVREVDGKLWIGTVAHNRIATLPYPLEKLS